MPRRAFLSTLLALLFLVSSAHSIIVIDDDQTENLAPPSDGSPWAYVARMNNQFGARATGVYLGSGYILTANHIDHDINLIFLNGANYAVDTTFTSIALQGTDMRIMRIVGDPGLPRLPLIHPWESEFNQPCTMMGYGVGKGTAVLDQGWSWADDTTRLKRWATNDTLGAYFTDSITHIDYVVTAFDRAAGPREGQLTGGDSGGPLFIKANGVWELAGIGCDVDVDNASLYDKDLSTPGNQPDHSYFASVKDILAQILAVVPATDEPIAVHVVVTGANVQVYWPLTAIGWSLYSAGDLQLQNWTLVTATPVTTSGYNQVTLPVSSAAQFFQLRQGG